VNATYGKVRNIVALLVLSLVAAWAVALALGQTDPPPDASPGVGLRADGPRLEKKAPKVDLFGDPLPDGALARLGTQRFRHGGASTLAFTPDDKAVVSFGSDRTLRTWDLASGRLLTARRLPGGPLFMPQNAVLSPDGRLVAFQDGSSPDAFLLWDVAADRLRHRLALGVREWHKAAFSHDGKTLVTGHRQGRLLAWDVDTGRERLLAGALADRTVPPGGGEIVQDVSDLSFSADGRLVVMVRDNHDRVRLWDVRAGRELPRITTPDDLYGATLSPDGNVVAFWRYTSAGVSGLVEFRAAATGKPVAGLVPPPEKALIKARFAPDGKSLWLGTPEGFRVWDPAAGKLIRNLPGGPGLNLTFSHTGKAVAALGAPHRFFPHAPVLRVWDAATGTPHPANAAERGHTDDVDAVAVAPDGGTVASFSTKEKRVRLWDASTGRPLRSLPPIEDLSRHHLAFARDGKHLFVGTLFGVGRWEVATGRPAGFFALSPEGGTEQRLVHMHLPDDGRSLHALSRSSDATCTLHAWDVTTRRRLQALLLPLREGGVDSTGGTSSGDGRLLAFPSGRIHDAATGKEILSLPERGWRSQQSRTLFSTDGALLANDVLAPGGPDGTLMGQMVGIQVWEAATRQPVATVRTGWAGHWAFTPDGRRLVTADREGLTLWDAATGKKLAHRPAPTPCDGTDVAGFAWGFATSFALAADGRTVATGHRDGTVLLWDLSPPRPAPADLSLTAQQREALWSDLAAADAGRAVRAMSRLADVLGQAAPLLRERLRPARRAPVEAVSRLLADLDAPRFEVRQSASERLAEMGEEAQPALREALQGQPSLEVRRRIERLLADLLVVRRTLRAVRVLEQIGTPEARRVLETLARGEEGMRLTGGAQAALGRLARRTGKGG
jgi:WD40 repeat protein